MIMVHGGGCLFVRSSVNFCMLSIRDSNKCIVVLVTVTGGNVFNTVAPR